MHRAPCEKLDALDLRVDSEAHCKTLDGAADAASSKGGKAQPVEKGPRGMCKDEQGQEWFGTRIYRIDRISAQLMVKRCVTPCDFLLLSSVNMNQIMRRGDWEANKELCEHIIEYSNGLKA